MTEVERIAALEARHEEMMRLLTEAHDDIKEMKQDLGRWKGVGAGIVITVSVLWGAAITVYQFVTGR